MDFYIYTPLFYLFNFGIPSTELRSYVEEYVIVYFYSHILLDIYFIRFYWLFLYIIFYWLIFI